MRIIRKVISGVSDIWPLLLFLLLLFIALLPSPAQAAGKDSIVLKKETILRMQQALAEQQQLNDMARDELIYWFEEFRSIKDCVRASKTHPEALVCIGDTQS